jgi:hypothetical protein
MDCVIPGSNSHLQADVPAEVHLNAIPSFRNFALSLLIVFVLYGDGLAILSEFPILCSNSSMKYLESERDSAIKIGGLTLSLPKLVFAFFNGGGVFNRVPDNNIEYAIYGRLAGADPKLPWHDLNYLKRCFPYECRGEIYTRLDLPWHKLMGRGAYTQAMSDLAAKIKNRYNMEHSTSPIDKVAIYVVWWPRSEAGFYKLRKPERTFWQLLVEG